MGNINIKFPLTDDVEKNFFAVRTQTTMDAIKSNIQLLIMTEKGSRYFMRDYGTDLIKYLFEPNDDITSTDIIDDIKNTVKKYMPKVTITSVTLPNTPDNNEKLLTINFTYNDNYYSESDTIQIAF